MYDGKYKNVQDICIGDKIMGDDNTKRNVLQLFRGYDDMYNIIPSRGDESFIVNKDHILSLKITNTISVYYRKERNTWNVSWKEKEMLKKLL